MLQNKGDLGEISHHAKGICVILSFEGDESMKENKTQTHYNVRDYSKPIMLKLIGIEGFRTYLKIITTPAKKYDAAAAKEKAAENLRKQELMV